MISSKDLSSIRKIFKESAQILFNRVKRSTSNVECKNKAGYLLEVRRWTFDVERSLIILTSDSCLLNSLFSKGGLHEI